jgi:hypothetical protein
VAVESADAARVVRYVHAEVARSLVDGGSAVISNCNGKVRAEDA